MKKLTPLNFALICTLSASSLSFANSQNTIAQATGEESTLATMTSTQPQQVSFAEIKNYVGLDGIIHIARFVVNSALNGHQYSVNMMEEYPTDLLPPDYINYLKQHSANRDLTVNQAFWITEHLVNRAIQGDAAARELIKKATLVMGGGLWEYAYESPTPAKPALEDKSSCPN